LTDSLDPNVAPSYYIAGNVRAGNIPYNVKYGHFVQIHIS